MKNENTQYDFDFWAIYEKMVSPLPEPIVDNSEAEILKKAFLEGGMADISFSAVMLPFFNRKEQEKKLKDMLEYMFCFDKIEKFDYNEYYNQYLQKQAQQNKELPLTDFVQILIDNKIIPAIDYKEYEEQVINKRIGSDNNTEVGKVTKPTRKMK